MYENLENVLNVARHIQDDVNETFKPPREGRMPRTDQVVEFKLVEGTRGYIEKTVIQINGCYENGWYDGCSVLLRKLMETLIIEAYEYLQIDCKIKDSSDEYVKLEELISRAKADLNLGRDTKRVMDELKKLGDRAAHNRRFYTRRNNIEDRLIDVQTLVQEFTSLAGKTG